RASKLIAHGGPVHSFQSLLRDLATCTLNEMTTTLNDAYRFALVATPTPTQAQAFNLLDVDPTRLLELTRFGGHLSTLRRRCHRCRRVTDPMRRNSGDRWLIWSDLGEHRRSCRASSNRLPRRSGTGFARPMATRAADRTARPAPSARS